MKDKDIFLIAIATLITAFSWLVFDSYHAYSSSSLPAEVVKAAIPITPQIDMSTIESIRKRQVPAISIPVPVVVPKIATQGGKKNG